MPTLNGELRPANYPWLMLTYYDPTVETGDIRNLPPSRLFADLGAAYLRDGWEEDTKVVMMFKCGPYGGYALNAYRNENDFHYINIAHDDPDANSVSLAVNGDPVLHPGRYFTMKKTAQHNTILVNGKGQIGEMTQYTQPIPNTDMTTLSYLTGWKTGDEGRVVIEGEAGNAYPDLTSFRRAAVWLPGDYVLILDTLRAEEEAEIVWQAFSKSADFVDPAAGAGVFVGERGEKVPYAIDATTALGGTIDTYVFKGRWGQTVLNRTRFDTKGSTLRIACLLDPWQRGDLTLTLSADGSRLQVKGKGLDDRWSWTPAGDLTTPSVIQGTRGGAELIRLTAEDKAPHGD